MTGASCPACGSANVTQRATVDDHPLLECRACSLRFHPRRAAEQSYDAGYFAGGDGASRGYRDYERVAAERAGAVYPQVAPDLLRRHPRRGRLLEVGCATGAFVEAAAADGWDAVGIDIADDAVRAGIERGRPLRACSLADAAFPTGHFDAVVAFHTLEHVADPEAMVQEMGRVSAGDATLVLEVPNLGGLEARLRGRRWSQIKPPEHLSYFNRRSLDALLGRAGWRVVSASTPTGFDVLAAGLADASSPRSRAAAVLLRVASAAGVPALLERFELGGALRVVAGKVAA